MEKLIILRNCRGSRNHPIDDEIIMEIMLKRPRPSSRVSRRIFSSRRPHSFWMSQRRLEFPYRSSSEVSMSMALIQLDVLVESNAILLGIRLCQPTVHRVIFATNVHYYRRRFCIKKI